MASSSNFAASGLCDISPLEPLHSVSIWHYPIIFTCEHKAVGYDNDTKHAVEITQVFVKVKTTTWSCTLHLWNPVKHLWEKCSNTKEQLNKLSSTKGSPGFFFHVQDDGIVSNKKVDKLIDFKWKTNRFFVRLGSHS